MFAFNLCVFSFKDGILVASSSFIESLLEYCCLVVANRTSRSFYFCKNRQYNHVFRTTLIITVSYIFQLSFLLLLLEWFTCYILTNVCNVSTSTSPSSLSYSFQLKCNLLHIALCKPLAIPKVGKKFNKSKSMYEII